MTKHTVYISAHLPHALNKGKKYGEKVYKQLKSIEEIDIEEIQNHSKNIWCRDYMPVKSATGKYIQFTYHPEYMRSDKYKDNFPDVKMICQKIGVDPVPSEIKLDSGAIEIHGKKGIVSDRVFRDNPNLSVSVVYTKLKKILDLEQLVAIPQYPYDFTGHVDGLVRFIDEKRVVVNDLKKELEQSEADTNQYRKKLIQNWIYAFQSALVGAGFELIQLPDSVPADGSPNSGEGIYINFLLLDYLIIMPVYETSKEIDVLAKEKLENLYDRKVIPVNAKELSQMGGMINCVTWTK